MSGGELAQLAREDELLGVAGAVDVDDVLQGAAHGNAALQRSAGRGPTAQLATRGEAAQHARDRRDPAAGAHEQQPPGTGSGRVKAPSTPPRRTIAPGRRRSQRNGETAPVGTSLGVIEMQPSARPGSEVSE